MNAIHQEDYSAIGTQHEQVTGRINDMLIELQNHAYATGVERGKALAKQAAIEAGTISPTLCQTIHLGQPGVTVEPCLMLGPAADEVACLLFTAPGTEVRLTWPTQTQALAVLAAATAEACTEADAPPVTCECGDSYPLSSHGAGFIEGRGHCANCAAGAGEMASLLGVSPAPVAALVEALKELISAAQSVNCSRHHRVAVAADDAPCYWQRKEWVDWLVESGKSASAALAAYLKQQAPAESGG